MADKEKSAKKKPDQPQAPLVFEVKEMLVSVTQKRGAYQAESYYGQVVVNPVKDTMLVTVDVEGLSGLDALKSAMEQIQMAAVRSVDSLMQKYQPTIVGAPSVVTGVPQLEAKVVAQDVRTGEVVSVESGLVSQGKEQEDDF